MKDIPTSKRIEDMKRRRRARRTRLTILIFVLITSLIYALGYFSSDRRVVINNIVVTGTQIINASDVETLTRQEISGKYLYFFDKSNAFIYPKNKLYSDLEKSFPRISKLSIYRDNFNTLHIDISERAGKALYCGKEIPEVQSEIGENCYFINNDGYIFDKAPYFSGNIYFKYYLDTTFNDPMGNQMLPQETFHEYARFIDSVTDLGFKPIYLTIESNGDSSLYLDHSLSNTSPKIVFKNDSDLVTVIDNLTLSMNKPEFANEINSKYTTLLYIDLRFKNKVLYKFQ